MDIIEKLTNLYKQTTITENADTIMEATKEIRKLRAALFIIKAQDSGKIGSTDKADCMAVIAEIALRRSLEL